MPLRLNRRAKVHTWFTPKSPVSVVAFADVRRPERGDGLRRICEFLTCWNVKRNAVGEGDLHGGFRDKIEQARSMAV